MNYILRLTRKLISWAISTHIITLTITVDKAKKAAAKADEKVALAIRVSDRALDDEQAAKVAYDDARRVAAATATAANAEISSLRSVAA